MNYKEKYEHGLECIQEILSGASDTIKTSILQKRLQPFFPELKESEDEEIRRWIIDDIRYNMNNEPLNNLAYKKKAEKAIAWLEKQGEKKSQSKSALEAINEVKVYNSNSTNGVPFDYENANIQQKDFAPKQGPKFQNGQWIVWLNQCYKVNYNGCGYKLILQNGLCTSLEYGTVDKSAHLWTLQDAKDGDVLYSIDSKQPFIYKERPQFSQARGYCCINKFGEFAIWNTSKCVICTDKYIPATKEQRDLLFQKMHESGYEWDADKRELKKMEQKPAEWSEEDEQIILSIEQIMNCASLLNIVSEKIDKIKSWLKSLKQRTGE